MFDAMNARIPECKIDKSNCWDVQQSKNERLCNQLKSA